MQTRANLTKIWTIKKYDPLSSVEIINQKLFIEVENAKPLVSISVEQGLLDGDFEARVAFDAFSSGTGLGGYAQMTVFEPDDENQGVAGTGIGPGAISAYVKYPSYNDFRFITGTSGTMMISRHGHLLTCSITVAGVTAIVNAPYLETKLNIGFQVGSNNEELVGTTAVRITDFHIFGGGGEVESDNFENT